MLVLTRRRDDTILIDGDIEIVVVSIREDRVRLGIRAPRETVVMRGEIADHRERFDIGGEAGWA